MHQLIQRLCVVPVLLATLLLPVSEAAPRNETISSRNEALQWWIDNATSGTPEFQYGLARMYSQGDVSLGIPKDAQQAFTWYQRAAERGHAKAQFALAVAYENGDGVARELATARIWYQRAAQHGHVGAKERLRPTAPAPDQPVAPAPAPLPTSSTTTEYLSWWAGALVLGFITIAFWRAMGAPLGVSSSWDRIVFWREDEENARAARMMQENKAQLTDALLAETIAQFGADAVKDLLKNQSPADNTVAAPAAQQHVPWPTHVTFLAMMAIGGLIAGVLSGEYRLQMHLGAEHARLFGAGAQTWLVLLAGGFLVGFGTRMCGGCTSGHGLSGCSRLQPGSLVSTASFFGAAVVASFLLEILK